MYLRVTMVFINYINVIGPNLVSNGKKKTIFDLECLNYLIPNSFFANKSINNANENFDQNVYNGYLNLTHVIKLPLFVSNKYLYKADLQEECQFINEEGNVLEGGEND